MTTTKIPEYPPDEVRETKRYMVIPMSAEEKADLADRLTKRMGEADALEARRSAIHKDLGDQLKEMQAECSVMARTHRQGGEMGMGATETRIYLAEGLAVEVVPLTGEVIEERALTSEERQGSLRLVDGEPCEVVPIAPARPSKPRAKKS